MGKPSAESRPAAEIVSWAVFAARGGTDASRPDQAADHRRESQWPSSGSLSRAQPSPVLEDEALLFVQHQDLSISEHHMAQGRRDLNVPGMRPGMLQAIGGPGPSAEVHTPTVGACPQPLVARVSSRLRSPGVSLAAPGAPGASTPAICLSQPT